MKSPFVKLLLTDDIVVPKLQDFVVVGQGENYLLLERPASKSAPKKRNRKAKEVPEAVEA